jgi:hypothetical protein
MKKYTYSGTSNLAFSFEGKDYLVYGHGPHQLPEEAPVVKSNVSLGNLVPVGEETKATNNNTSK